MGTEVQKGKGGARNAADPREGGKRRERCSTFDRHNTVLELATRRGGWEVQGSSEDRERNLIQNGNW